MKKYFKISLIIVIPVSVFGCAKAPKTLETPGNSLVKEFGEEISIEVYDEKTDRNELLGSEGFYTEKMIVLDSEGNELLNFELFDNVASMNNRFDYIEYLFESLENDAYVVYVKETGGKGNAAIDLILETAKPKIFKKLIT